MGLGKTEWEDILIEKGIINPPKETQIDHHPDIVYDISNGERDEVDELFSDEDDDFIRKYKELQLQKLKSENYFGTMTEISRSDFLAEVTETSKRHPVIVFLYQTSNIHCQILAKWLSQEGAPSNPTIKFIQMVSTRCIPNYPDANLPTILLYRLGAVQKQILQADAHRTQELIQQIHEAEQDQNQQRQREQETENERDLY